MTDANGLPLLLVVSVANTHDIKLFEDTLDELETGRQGRRYHLCIDKGYESHIQSRKEEVKTMRKNDFKAHRWVVERTHSWMNRFRRVLTRWEKKVENYEAVQHFACSIIVWNKTLLG